MGKAMWAGAAGDFYLSTYILKSLRPPYRDGRTILVLSRGY